MATINQNIDNIKEVKNDIKDAIIEKGIDMENVPFTEYAAKIGEITGGEDRPVVLGTFDTAQVNTNTLAFGRWTNVLITGKTGAFTTECTMIIEWRRRTPSAGTFFTLCDYEFRQTKWIKLTQIDNSTLNISYNNNSNGESWSIDCAINEDGNFHVLVIDNFLMKLTLDGVNYSFVDDAPTEFPALNDYIWEESDVLDFKRFDIFIEPRIISIRPTENGELVRVHNGTVTVLPNKTYYEPEYYSSYEYITDNTPVYFDRVFINAKPTLDAEFFIPNDELKVEYNAEDVRNLTINSFYQNNLTAQEHSNLNNKTTTEPITITENGVYSISPADESYIWYKNPLEKAFRTTLGGRFAGWEVAQTDVIEVQFRATNEMIGSAIPWLFGKTDEASTTTKNKYGIELNQSSTTGDCWLNFWMGQKLGKYFFKSGQWVTVKTYPNPENQDERIIEIDDGGYNNTVAVVNNTLLTYNINPRTQLFGLYGVDNNYGGILPGVHLKYLNVWESLGHKAVGLYKYNLEAKRGENFDRGHCNISNAYYDGSLFNGKVIIPNAQIMFLPEYQKGYNEITVDVPNTGSDTVDVAAIGLKFGVSTFSTLPDIFDFSNVTDMTEMFFACKSLQTIPEINTSNVTSMNFMFTDCGVLQTIPQLNTSNVQTMNGMFNTCDSLQSIPELDTSNVIEMGGMFNNCSSLQSIPELDTSNVQTMNGMFSGCRNLQSIPSLNTSNVNNMEMMFYGCELLQTVPELNTNNVTNMYGMFNSCTGLTSLPSFNVEHLEFIIEYFGWGTTMENLTEVGGWINLKCNWDDDFGLAACPNLTYQSCINILNGLADVTELGGMTLKVHQNFLTTVGDEISIGTNKGWTISA